MTIGPELSYQPPISVATLADLIFPVSARVRLMVMLTGYFDASGTDEQSPTLIVAGWLAPAKQWAQFQVKWEEELHKESVKIFHATDCETFHKEFVGWAPERKRRFQQNLIRTIRRYAQYGVAAAVTKSEYEPERHKYAEPNSPYIFCLGECLKMIRQWVDQHYPEEHEIAYFVEAGDGVNRDIGQFNEVLYKNAEYKRAYRFQPIILRDKSLNPLQAADLLAYEVKKEMENFFITGKETRPLRQLSIGLLRNFPYSARHFPFPQD